MSPTCPTCHNMGMKIKRITLDSLLRSECLSHVIDVQYYVCISPDCHTVYYDEDGKCSFDKSDLTVRFGLKETESPRPLCYCFNHTSEEIETKIRHTGRSTVVERIKAEMKGPGCRCQYTNPLGCCCLKSVQEVVANALLQAGQENHHADSCTGDVFSSKENTMPDCCSNNQEDMNEPTPSAAVCCQAEDTSLQASSHGDRAGALAASGSVLAAMLSSTCCWLPLLLITFGVSAVGVAGFFSTYRPLFLTLAVGLLSLGYYRVYFRKAACKAGSACATPNTKLRHVNQAMLWMSTALVGAFIFFPNYVGDVFGAPPSANAGIANANLETAVYHIEDMTCQGCADILSGKLSKLPGVKGVKVDYEKKTAVLRFDPAKPVPPKQVLALVKMAGYSGTFSRKVQAH